MLIGMRLAGHGAARANGRGTTGTKELLCRDKI